MHNVGRLLLKLYKGYCYFVGTLAMVLLLLIAMVNIIKRSDTYKLPNATFISRLNFFSDHNESSLRSPDGIFIHDGALKDICFNEHYVHGRPENGRNFIYSSEKGGVVFETDPSYGKTYEASKLSISKNLDCNGSFGIGRRF